MAGEPCRSGMGMEFPGPVRGDGLGNHRMHDILLACGTTLFDAVIDIVLEGYDSLAASNSFGPLARNAAAGEGPGHVAHGPDSPSQAASRSAHG
jgi:hypothetical protein